MHLSRTAATVCLLALLTACGDDADQADPTPTTHTPTTEAPTTEPATDDGPVPGSGASLDPGTAGWCAAISPDQLTALTGLEAGAVDDRGTDLETCSVDLDGIDPTIFWGSQTTRMTQEQYAASFTRPAGAYDVSEVTLPSGQPAVVATNDVPQVAFAGAVVDGRVIQARVIYLAPDDSVSADDLSRIVQAVVAVYAA